MKFDVNDDGLVDVFDVSLIIDCILGKPDALAKILCDVDGDGLVDVTDVSKTISCVLGKEE